MMKIRITKDRIENLFMIDLSRFYLINKRALSILFFNMGMMVAFLGSLNPWFMWPIGSLFSLPACLLLIISMELAKSDSGSYYNRTDFLLPILAYILLSYYQIFIRSGNVFGYVSNLFRIIVFYALFKVREKEVKAFCDLLSKIMGGFLVISMFFFLLYLFGFPLPSRDADFNNLYSYTNYYFFLLDDRNLFTIIPRFHSVFLEPGHMGTMTVMLLFTQIGKWKRWYNIALIIATLISFSLAAYGLFVGLVFLSLWIRGKHFIKKAIIAVGLFAAVTIGSFFYNNGDNLLYNLIMVRLEMNDGEMVGNNRVSDSFLADYENLIKSSDILIGRDRNTEIFGNSGYRVFIYDYGLIGVFLLLILYVVSFYNPQSLKAMTAVFIIGGLNFIIRGNPLWYANFIPLYCVARCFLSEANIHQTNINPQEYDQKQ